MGAAGSLDPVLLSACRHLAPPEGLSLSGASEVGLLGSPFLRLLRSFRGGRAHLCPSASEQGLVVVNFGALLT